MPPMGNWMLLSTTTICNMYSPSMERIWKALLPLWEIMGVPTGHLEGGSDVLLWADTVIDIISPSRILVLLKMIVWETNN